MDDTSLHETYTVLANTSYMDTIIQVRGRIRQDIRNLFHKDNTKKSKILSVPQEYLGVHLLKADKDKLVQEFDLVNKDGKQLK